MRILYTGGGTMGSVSPLVAIHQKIVSESQSLGVLEYKCLWLGTQTGPEREVIEQVGIKFEVIASGKIRRYFDLKNLLDSFRIIIGFFQALYFIFKFDPDVILTAGSFVAVPVAWAGFFNNVPVFIHQQDVEVGLANKLMAPVAKKITVALEKSLQDFKFKKTFLVGNPIRQEMFINDKEINFNNDKQIFNFKNNLPIILVIGGGTGALALNKLVGQALKQLQQRCNIIHVTGKNKMESQENESWAENYIFFNFLDARLMSIAYKLAEVVVSRAGLSSLTELAYFKKPTIIIPIPNSHQEKNAEYFANQDAAVYLSQKNLTTEKFVAIIDNLLADKTKQQLLGEKMQRIFIDYFGEKYLDVVLK